MELRHCFDKLCMLSIRAIRSVLLTAIPCSSILSLKLTALKRSICFHVVQNLPAVFKPDDPFVSVFVLVARRSYSGGKVVD